MTSAAEAVEILKAGRKKIVSGWTIRAYARDNFDHEVAAASPTATKWCAFGAVDEVSRRQTMPEAGGYLSRALPKNWNSVLQYNDASLRTKADILRLYDNAITLAKGDVARGM